jgi:hypothetical protein
VSPLWPWLVVFGLFVAGLVHQGPYLIFEGGVGQFERSRFSDAHHFWYFSTLYWMGYALLAPWPRVRLVACALCLLAMLEDAIEHWTRGRFAPIKTLYGKLGGTW